MRKTIDIGIGGHRYQTAQLGAVTGRKLYLRLIKLLSHFAPLLGTVKELVRAAKKSGAQEGDEGAKLGQLLDRIDEGAVFTALVDALEHIDESELEAFWEAYAAQCWVMFPHGRQLLSECFDEHFAGRYVDMMKLFVSLTRFNFGDFLAGLGGPEGAPPAPVASPSP